MGSISVFKPLSFFLLTVQLINLKRKADVFLKSWETSVSDIKQPRFHPGPDILPRNRYRDLFISLFSPVVNVVELFEGKSVGQNLKSQKAV